MNFILIFIGFISLMLFVYLGVVLFRGDKNE